MPKLSAADLEGSEIVVPAPAPKRLTAGDLEGSEVVTSPSPAPARDVHAMARAEAGRPAGPRDLTSEQAGTSPGLQTQRQPLATLPPKPGDGLARRGVYLTEQAPAPADAPPSDYTRVAERYPGTGNGMLNAFGPAKTITVGRNEQEMADPLVQMGTATALGMAAGAVPVEAAELAGAPAAVVRGAKAIAPSVETGVANKAMGGDFTTGAAIGGIVPALPYAAKGIGAARRAVGEGLEQRMVKDITKGKRPGLNASKPTTEEVKALAGPDAERLAQTVRELPESRAAIMVTGKTNPARAAKVITHDIDAAVSETDGVVSAIQRETGGIPLKPYVDRLKALEDRLNLQKRGAEADAIGRVRADILKPKRHGLEGKALTPEQLAEVKMSAQSVRNMRNDIGDLIDPTKTIDPNTKASAMDRVHRLLNKEIEDAAEATPGVDVEALRRRNRQISTLIPVRDALLERADKLADRDLSIFGRAKELPGKAVRSVARRARYGAASFPEANPAPLPTKRTPLFNETQPGPPVEPPIVYPTDELRRRRELEALGLTAAAGNRR